MRYALVIALFTAIFAGAAGAQPQLPADARTIVAEAYRLSDAIGDRIWPGWSKVPFDVIIVVPGQQQFPITRDALREGRAPSAEPSQWQPSIAATMDHRGRPTVFVGFDPASPPKPTALVLTLLHEHFHQLQMSSPGYYAATQQLDLARGDTTGMWMLNYPFPYSDPPLNGSFAAAGKLLDRLIAGGDRELVDYGAVRSRLTSTSPADARYLEFQMWQEGVAMYTQYKVADWAAHHYRPTAAFRRLHNAEPFASAAAATLRNIREQLASLPLSGYKRVAFYYLGAGEAIVADRVDPPWRDRYLRDRFRGPLQPRE